MPFNGLEKSFSQPEALQSKYLEESRMSTKLTKPFTMLGSHV